MNALYFDICALFYDLFALMRQLLPVEFVDKRAKCVCHCLYAVAMICLSKFCLTLGGLSRC